MNLPLFWKILLAFWLVVALTIGLVAIANGAIVQLVMGSRVLYGLAKEGLLPRPFSVVHPRTKTPLLSTLVVGGAIVLLATTMELEMLAKVTSFIILSVFVLVNSALVVLKVRGPQPEKGFRVPIVIPILGAIACVAMVALSLVDVVGLTH